MELFLNLIWTSIAIAASLRFARWSAGQSKRRRRLVGLATLCVIAVLFPIISVTDDLHSDVAMLEEETGVRRSAASGHIHHVVFHVVALPAVAAARSLAQLLLIGSIAAEPLVRHREVASVAAAIRPPPSSRA